MPLVARHEPAVVLQPRQEAFDLSAAAVAAQGPSILRSVAPPRAIPGDELNPLLGQLGIQPVGVVATFADDPRREAPDGAALQRVRDEKSIQQILVYEIGSRN